MNILPTPFRKPEARKHNKREKSATWREILKNTERKLLLIFLSFCV
jgi:hypothetical protein